ncbi:MAG: hypothetical protein ACO1OB_01020 [Archangium sp.]
MAYPCPKCGGPTERSSSRTAQAAGGLVGALLYMAFAGFNCVKCGALERSAFPDEVRSKMMLNSVLMIFGAIVLLIAVIVLIVATN